MLTYACADDNLLYQTPVGPSIPAGRVPSIQGRCVHGTAPQARAPEGIFGHLICVLEERPPASSWPRWAPLLRRRLWRRGRRVFPRGWLLLGLVPSGRQRLGSGFRYRVRVDRSRRREHTASLGLGGELNRLFLFCLLVLLLAAQRCRKRRRVLTCALILSAPGPRWGIGRGPCVALAPTLMAREAEAGGSRGARSFHRSARRLLPSKLFPKIFRPLASSIKSILKDEPAFKLRALIMCLV